MSNDLDRKRWNFKTDLIETWASLERRAPSGESLVCSCVCPIYLCCFYAGLPVNYTVRFYWISLFNKNTLIMIAIINRSRNLWKGGESAINICDLSKIRGYIGDIHPQNPLDFYPLCTVHSTYANFLKIR